MRPSLVLILPRATLPVLSNENYGDGRSCCKQVSLHWWILKVCKPQPPTWCGANLLLFYPKTPIELEQRKKQPVIYRAPEIASSLIMKDT